MRSLRNLIIFMFCLVTLSNAARLFESPIQYLHPRPNSTRVSPRTTIIFRFDATEVQTPSQINISVTGEQSGIVTGDFFRSSDKRTFIFKPAEQFSPEELVTVEISVPVLAFSKTFSFTTSLKAMRETDAQPEPENLEFAKTAPVLANKIQSINGVSVPNNFPTFKPTITNNPGQGSLFISTEYFLMILKNDGTPLFYNTYGSRRIWDFTIQPSGALSVVVGATGYTMNEHFEVTNQYACGHGYYMDPHDFIHLSNGHTFLIGWEEQVFDLSQLTPEGNTSAKIIGTHIQELDSLENVIFEWRCWDNYNITDALHSDLRNKTIHYVHMNAIDLDYDGNILVSSRHLDEITKINRDTGEIIWRLGGNNNQFEFVNDPDRFTYQHDIRAVPGKPGYYTVFDNGNYHDPTYSRGVQYKLDTEKMTAEKVWEYRQSPDLYSNWMGNVQLLENGNYIVGWSHRTLPKISEVTPEGELLYQGNFTSEQTTYRVHRFDWEGKAIRPFLFVDAYENAAVLIMNQFGDPDVEMYYIYSDIKENPAVLIDSTTGSTYQFTEFISNDLHFFRVKSRRKDGTISEFSNEVEAKGQFSGPQINQIVNGSFSQDVRAWTLNLDDTDAAEWEVTEQEELKIDVLKSDLHPMDVQLIQTEISLTQGQEYQFSFTARSSSGQTIGVALMNEIVSIDFSQFDAFTLSDSNHTYVLDFTMNDFNTSDAWLVFNLGYAPGEVYLDNISLMEKSAAEVQSENNELPSTYRLFPAYPNPFNAVASIKYDLPDVSEIHLAIFDLLGRRVKEINLKKQSVGTHAFHFDASGLSSGIYFCRLNANSLSKKEKFSRIIKMVYVK